MTRVRTSLQFGPLLRTRLEALNPRHEDRFVLFVVDAFKVVGRATG